jgi:site-specific recombinase XerD
MLAMTTSQALQIFLRALQGQNFSPKTLRAYGDDLTQFLAFVERNRVDWEIPTRLTRADIEGFMHNRLQNSSHTPIPSFKDDAFLTLPTVPTA